MELHTPWRLHQTLIRVIKIQIKDTLNAKNQEIRAIPKEKKKTWQQNNIKKTKYKLIAIIMLIVLPTVNNNNKKELLRTSVLFCLELYVYVCMWNLCELKTKVRTRKMALRLLANASIEHKFEDPPVCLMFYGLSKGCKTKALFGIYQLFGTTIWNPVETK